MHRYLAMGRVEPIWMAEGGADYSSTRVMAANGYASYDAVRSGLVWESKWMPGPLSSLDEWGESPGYAMTGYRDAYNLASPWHPGRFWTRLTVSRRLLVSGDPQPYGPDSWIKTAPLVSR